MGGSFIHNGRLFTSRWLASSDAFFSPFAVFGKLRAHRLEYPPFKFFLTPLSHLPSLNRMVPVCYFSGPLRLLGPASWRVPLFESQPGPCRPGVNLRPSFTPFNLIFFSFFFPATCAYGPLRREFSKRVSMTFLSSAIQLLPPYPPFPSLLPGFPPYRVSTRFMGYHWRSEELSLTATT